jgi:hypothetical protein
MRKNANTIPLRQAVESHPRLLVDDYQRTYQWGVDQIDDLMTDLFDTLDAQDDHFFGTLILQDSDENGATIVDGQQRLTTVFVLVATLRDQIKRTGMNEITPDDLEEMPINVWEKTRNFLYFSNKYGDYRMSPNRFIKALFEDSVMALDDKKKPIPAKDRQSTLAFRKAVRHIRDVVESDLGSLEGAERLARINKILDTLLDRFLVLRVATASMDESLEIFLTLNDRGQALGPSDLVRGDVLLARGFGLAEKEKRKLQEEVTTEWESVMETVVEPETFLRHFLVATTGEKVQKKRVVKTVKEIIVGETPEAKKAEAALFWQKLIGDSEVYGEIISPTGSGKIDHLLELVHPLAKSQRIMLLPILREVDDQVARTELVRLVVVLAFRWVVAGRNAQKLEDFFQDQCARSGDDDFAEILKKNLKEKIASCKIDAREYFMQEAGNSYVVRALLYAIDKVLRGAANPLALDPSAIHVEHIAPQKPTPSWLEALGLQGDAEAYGLHINSPGNLTLLDQKLNIQAQRKPFVEKRDNQYDKSNVKITRDLKEISSWSIDLIDSRTLWLAEMFDLVWSLDDADLNKVVPFHKWLSGK